MYSFFTTDETEHSFVRQMHADMISEHAADKSPENLQPWEQVHHLFEQAPTAIMILKGPEFIVELANAKVLEIIGRTREEALGNKLGEVLPELEMQNYLGLMQMVYTSGERYVAQEAAVTFKRNNTRIDTFIKFVFQPLKDDHNNVTGLMITGDDVGEQVMARKKIEDSEERFRAIAHDAPLFVWETDENLQTTFLNKTGQDYFQAQDIPLAELSWKPFIHPDDLDMALSVMNDAAQKKQSYTLEMRLKNGRTSEYRWFLDKGVPRYANDKLIGFIGTSLDIHDRKVKENTSRENEKELQQLFKQAQVSILVLQGPEYRVDVANNKALEHWGKSEEEVIGKPLFDIAPEVREMMEPLLCRVYTTGEPYVANEFLIPYSKGNTLHSAYFDFLYKPVYNSRNEITGIITIGNDVTHSVLARKKIENFSAELELKVKERTIELENSQSFLRQVLDSSVEYIGVLDKNLCFVTANERYENAIGFTRSGMVGKHVLQINPKIEGSEQYRAILKASKGEIVHLDTRPAVANPDIYVDTYYIPLVLHNEVEGVIIMARDVTEIVQTEKLLEQKNTELEQSNKELESFNYIASHDLQEPLRKIQIFSNILQEKMEIDSAGGKYLEKIREAAFRMSQLIQSVLDYSRLTQRTQAFAPTDLNVVLEHVKSDHELIIAEKEAIIESDVLPTVQAIPLQMQQLFSNLLSNSLKFSGKKPQINISYKTVASDDVPFDTAGHAKYAEIRFRDNGIGFDPEFKEQIFKLFQRLHTHDDYHGTGVGLSIVQKIVEQHNGFISAESEKNKGATFIIWLPL